MRSSSFIVLALLVGCAAKRDPAPEDLDGLVRFMFVNWEDQELLDAAMVNLAPWMESEGTTEKASKEGFLLSDMSAEEVGVVPHPDEDLSRMVGVAVAGVSPYPVRDHAALIVLEDQLWNDAASYDRYTREILEGDAEAFVDGAMIRTLNDIDKSTLGVHIPYLLNKDFKWAIVDDDRSAIVARSWVAEQSCSDGGANCINISFSVDMWYGSSAESTTRLTASWNDIKSSVDAFLSEKQKVGLMVSGINKIFENTDELLDAED